MPSRPILCGKCGTSSDEAKVLVITKYSGYEILVSCQHDGCGHSVSSDSIPAALAKFEEPVKNN